MPLMLSNKQRNGAGSVMIALLFFRSARNISFESDLVANGALSRRGRRFFSTAHQRKFLVLTAPAPAVVFTILRQGLDKFPTNRSGFQGAACYGDP